MTICLFVMSPSVTGTCVSQACPKSPAVTTKSSLSSSSSAVLPFVFPDARDTLTKNFPHIVWFLRMANSRATPVNFAPRLHLPAAIGAPGPCAFKGVQACRLPGLKPFKCFRRPFQSQSRTPQAHVITLGDKKLNVVGVGPVS